MKLKIASRRQSGLCFIRLLCAAAMLPAGPAANGQPGAEITTSQVAGRQVDYLLMRHGKPVVVFENGLGGTLDNWRLMLPEISRHATLFAYNRPGYGDSEPAATPRDGEHVAEELRALLRALDLKPPYVLVGHSLGGLYMQYFARRHPAEVAGLVLVDSTHPLQFQGQGAAPYPSNSPDMGLRPRGRPAAREEWRLIDATGESVMALPALRGKPVIVLSALKPLSIRNENADAANEKRRDLARLYPGAKQVWVDSGHRIPLERPEAVVEAVREIVSRMGK
jgi:pimeloyl-ACP methyl ester carboxylesterase